MRQRFHQRLDNASSVLIAGAGGGFDVFSGLPLYFALRAAGKQVHLANLTFANIHAATGHFLTPNLLEVTSEIIGRETYFPELHLTRWFRHQGEEVPVYCIDRTGAEPVRQAYECLVEKLSPDAVVLVDGGTDSLMRGDEFGLGTPEEDLASIAAVDSLPVPIKLLTCIGFGIDTFHGICHAHFLEAVAAITEKGGFLGAWSLCQETPEFEKYRAACHFVFDRMPRYHSIVNGSIISAVEGKFGNHQITQRTGGSELFINPLMSLYWAFDLHAVAERHLFLGEIRDSETHFDLSVRIAQCRSKQEPVRQWRDLPM